MSQQLSYNAYGEPIQDQTSLPGGTQFKAEYQRDAAGRITQKIETTPAGARTFDYEYNDAGQLESVTKDGSVSHLDSRGDRIIWIPIQPQAGSSQRIVARNFG